MINHFHSIQLRITGTGNLKGTLYSLPDRDGNMVSQDLQALNMTTQNSKMPILLCNFKQERMKMKIYTTDIDEIFTIRKISIFVKPIYSGIPQ